MEQEERQDVAINWKQAWRYGSLRKKIIIGLLLLIGLLIAMPLFFSSIENRNGADLNDFILNKLPAIDLSIPIFILIWLTGSITLYQSIKNPQVFILFLWSFIFMTLSRMLTISLVSLNPPASLIPLVDPIENIFYGGKFISKDLFYSGHTATLFLSFLCLQKKVYKAIALFATVVVGVMLLIQHVHYSIDVIAAPLITFLMFLLARFYVVNT